MNTKECGPTGGVAVQHKSPIRLDSIPPGYVGNLFIGLQARPCLIIEAGPFCAYNKFEVEELLMIFSGEWFVALGSILFVNLILSGDNAVIIAMASKSLPVSQRTKAVLWGCIGAVVLRCLLTFLAASMLDIPYLQFIGGLALLWIAVGLLGKGHEEVACEEASSFKEAIKIILFADLIMSLDNVLALAAVAQTIPDSKYSLIIVGLATSIPLVVFGAQMLMKLMDRFPIIIYIGAAVLGYAASEMIVGDKAVGPMIGDFKMYIVVLLTVGVVAIGHWKKQQARKVKSAA